MRKPKPAQFAGLDYWLGGMAWQVPRALRRASTSKTLPVLDVLGNTQQIANPGVLEFELGGKPLRLEALDEGEARCSSYSPTAPAGMAVIRQAASSMRRCRTSRDAW